MFKRIVHHSKHKIFTVLNPIALIIVLTSASFAQEDYWQKTAGPEGANVRLAQIDPLTNDIYLVLNTGQLYKSSDNGQSWAQLSDPPITIYAMTIGGSGDLYIAPSGSARILKSTDGGSLWTELTNLGFTYSINSLAYDPNSTFLFAGTQFGGVFRSTDDGDNWTEQNAGLTNYANLRMWTIYTHSNGNIYIGAWEWSQTGGVYLSADKGASWNLINGDIANTNIRGVAVNDSGHIFAATYGGAIYRSTNNGLNWIRKSSGIDSFLSNVIILPNGNVLVGSVQKGLFLSTDNGENWSNPVPAPSDFGVQALAYDPVNQIVFAGLDGAGVISSTNSGLNWIWKNIGLTYFDGNDLLIDNANIIYTCAYSSSIFRSRNGGESWERADNGMPSVRATSIAFKPGYLFAGTMFTGLFRSMNGGDSWEDISGGGGNTSQVPYVFVSSKGDLFAQTGTVYSLNKSTDNGNSWSEVRSTEYQDAVGAMAEKSEAGLLFAGLNGGGMIRSDDDGENWAVINNGLTNLNVGSLLVLPSGDVLAGTNAGLFRTNNDGDEWVESPLPTGGTIHAMEIDSLGQIFVGASSFVYISRDDGITWDLFRSGLSNLHLSDLELDSENVLYAATNSGGVYKTVKPTVEPAVPNLIEPADSQTDVSNPPTLIWGTAPAAQTYELQVALDAQFTNMAHQQTGMTDTSLQVNGLSDGSTYYWRVRSVNSFSSSDWTVTWKFTTKEPIIINAPSLIEPTAGATDVGIPAKLVWEEFTTATPTYQLQVSTQSDFSTTYLDMSGLTSAIYYVDGLAYNTQYYWRVKTSVDTDEGPWSSFYSFTTYQQQTTASTSVNFPSRPQRDDYAASDYRLFGLPGSANIDLKDVLGSDVGNTWTAYWDNGGSGSPQDYLEEYDNSSTFTLTEGRAFWIIYNGSIQVNQQVNQIDLNANGEAEIAIHPGYNMITCPYTFAVNWNLVQTLNSTSEQLYRFDGSFSTATQLEPYRGYYFFNENSSRTVLRIPYSGTGTLIIPDEPDWIVGISLLTEGSIESTNRIGVSPRALQQVDQFDYHKPRAVGEIAGVYFSRPEWDEQHSTFASDIRPQVDDLERWTFDVIASKNSEAVLSFPGVSDIPDEYDVYLLDKSRFKAIDLRLEPKYTFTPVKKAMSFEIVVGGKAAVEDVIQELLPDKFALGRNYPNPFNPTTTIPFVIAEKSTVTLTVYDMLGRKVKSILSGELETGRYYYNWDGTDTSGRRMSSGIYFYRLQTGQGRLFTGKMIMVK